MLYLSGIFSLCICNNYFQSFGIPIDRVITFLGKLIGRYFDSEGNPTSYHEKLLAKFKKSEEHEENKNLNKLMFPPCNVEWTLEKGSRVWCTKQRFDIIISIFAQ